MRFTTANVLTILRIFIAPIFLTFYLVGTESGFLIATVLFIAGAVSDYLDGWFARRYNQVTEIGSYLDPLADKILILSALVAFYINEVLPLWMLLIIVIRDFGTTILRSIMSNAGSPLKTSFGAKFKTMFQMTFVCYILLLSWADESGSLLNQVMPGGLHGPVTVWATWILTIFTIGTAVEYAIVNRKVILRGFRT